MKVELFIYRIPIQNIPKGDIIEGSFNNHDNIAPQFYKLRTREEVNLHGSGVLILLSCLIWSQRTRDAITTSWLLQNDVVTSFWHNNDVIITPCVHYVYVSFQVTWWILLETSMCRSSCLDVSKQQGGYLCLRFLWSRNIVLCRNSTIRYPPLTDNIRYCSLH